MRIFHDFTGVADRPFVLAAGVFDGIHAGHRAVIARAVGTADLMGASTGVLTFFPHPATVLLPGKNLPVLAERSLKFELLAQCGVDFCIELPFTKELAAMPAREFLSMIENKSMRRCKGIAAGWDWTFGAGRAGSMKMIAELENQTGLRALPVGPVLMDGAPVSSSRIRAAVAEGALDSAASWLGRPYEIRGTVIRGAGIGARLGFPTANVDYDKAALPPMGVYGVEGIPVDSPGRTLDGVANLGVRPSVNPEQTARPVLEAHFPDFSGDLYGRMLSLRFEKFLRPEKKFPSLDALREQIAMDVRQWKSRAV